VSDGFSAKLMGDEELEQIGAIVPGEHSSSRCSTYTKSLWLDSGCSDQLWDTSNKAIDFSDE